MPKVSEEYFNEKKNSIMDGAMELMKEKPLYQITMRDIIKKLDVSQGVIYRYYKELDEIFLDLMNRETKGITIQDRMDQILQMEDNESLKLKQLFLVLGDYMVQVQKKIGGKFYFEFLVSYAFDEEKQKTLLPRLEFKKNLMAAQEKMILFIAEQIKMGAFRPKLPFEDIISYVSVTIDGISNDYALRSQGNEKENLRPELLFEMLADCTLQYLNA